MNQQKSSVEEIRQRFDTETAIYTNLDTGQLATMDAPLSMKLITDAAAITTPHAKELLDVGCGGGNYSMKMLERLPNLNVTLIDLSQVMLDKAVQRISVQTTGTVTPIQSDIRQIEIGKNRFDLILASAVLHHLRTDDEWQTVFQKLYDATKPNGSLWIFDIVESRLPEIQTMHWQRYGDYLSGVGGTQYRDTIFERIIEEDTPRSVPFQLELLKAVGFKEVELLHKNACYAAFGAIKR